MPPTPPFFSVVIPTYNRPQQLAELLGALCRQDCADYWFEVIVVDDGSQLVPNLVVAKFADQLEIKLVRQKNAGPAMARNTGAAQAQGAYLAFTDDDCLPEPGWLDQLRQQLLLRPDVIVGGHTINRLLGNPYAATSQLIIDIVYRHYNPTGEDAQFFASNNIVVSRLTFVEMGGFDQRLRTAEDREFCDRWKDRGLRLVYVAQAVVGHAHPLDMARFIKQHFQYGVGAHRYNRLRAQMGARPMEKGLKLHLNLKKWLFQPFYRCDLFSAVPMALLLVVWQLANAAGFFCEAIAARDQDGAEQTPLPAQHRDAVELSETEQLENREKR